MTEQQLRTIIRQEIKANDSSSRFGFNQIPRHVHNGIDSPAVNNNNVVKNVPVVGSVTMARTTRYIIGLANTPATATTVSFNGSVVNSIVGALTGATVGIAGTGYHVGDILVVAGGAGGRVSVSTIDGLGGITAIVVTDTGSDYTTGNGVAVSGGHGTKAKLDITATTTASITIRAHCIGFAVLSPGFNLQPSTSSSVTAGGPQIPLIQSSSMFLIDSSTNKTVSVSGGGGGTVSVPNPTVRVITDELHIIDVEYGGVKARADIISYNKNALTVEVTTLASGWSIVGNWTIT